MARTSTLLAVIALAVLTPAVSSDSTPLDESAIDAALLSKHRIEPTRAGVTAFLSQLKADLVDAKSAEKFIPQLGAAKFREREEAERLLMVRDVFR